MKPTFHYSHEITSFLRDVIDDDDNFAHCPAWIGDKKTGYSYLVSFIAIAQKMGMLNDEHVFHLMLRIHSKQNSHITMLESEAENHESTIEELSNQLDEIASALDDIDTSSESIRELCNHD